MSREMTDATERHRLKAEYYDTPTLVFHWLTAVLVVVLMGTALVWNYVTPHDRYWRPLLESSHVSLGILFAVLIAVRLAWRVSGARRLQAEAGVSGLLSRMMYLVLYVLIAAEAVLGFLLRWYQGERFDFFGLFTVPALFAQDRSLAHQFEDLHNWVAWAIIILAAGHAAAALIHHYVLKDAVMGRMLFHRTPSASR